MLTAWQSPLEGSRVAPMRFVRPHQQGQYIVLCGSYIGYLAMLTHEVTSASVVDHCLVLLLGHEKSL